MGRRCDCVKPLNHVPFDQVPARHPLPTLCRLLRQVLVQLGHELQLADGDHLQLAILSFTMEQHFWVDEGRSEQFVEARLEQVRNLVH